MIRRAQRTHRRGVEGELRAAAWARGGWYLGLWFIGIVVALITAFYMTRLMILTFFGEARWDEGAHPHESPPTMTVPLIILALFSAVAGPLTTAAPPPHFPHSPLCRPHHLAERR